MTIAATDLHNQTELPGMLFPADTHDIINFRYWLAKQFIHDKTVLEVGCGAGFGAKALHFANRYYVGGEFTEQNIGIYNKTYENALPIIQLDAHDLPFANGSFDACVAMAMIYYLDFERFLVEAFRVLAPNGNLFFCTSNCKVPGFVASPYTKQYYAIPELDNLLKCHGFEAKFYGAFKAVGGSLLASLLKAAMKNTCKTLLCSTQRGRNMWQQLKLKQAGKRYPLPNSVAADNEKNIEFVELDAEKIDRVHRVIYVLATKRE